MVVARGFIVSKDPSTKVGGTPLGEDFWEVYIEKTFVTNEPLPRPYGNKSTIGDAYHSTVAWHIANVLIFNFNFLIKILKNKYQ